MEFGAYLDESGTHDKNLLIVAAYVADVSTWSKFSDDWSGILSKYGVSYLHIKDFRNGHSKLYRHLCTEQRKALLSDCIACINEHVLFGFCIGLLPRLYKHLTTPAFRNNHGSAYTFAIGLCITGCREQLTTRFDGMHLLNVALESGHKNANDAIEKLTILRESIAPVDASAYEDGAVHEILPDPVRNPTGIKIGSIGMGTKGGKHALPPLQAADILAYCLNAQARKLNDPFASDILERGAKADRMKLGFRRAVGGLVGAGPVGMNYNETIRAIR